jgi:hypothetical protein
MTTKSSGWRDSYNWKQLIALQMFQRDTVWTAWLCNVQCLKLDQDSPVTAYFKWINSAQCWNVIVTENNKTLRSRIWTINYSGATDIIHYFNLLKYIHTTRSCCTGRVAQLVQWLATAWTVRGSNPGRGEIFRTRLDRPWGLPRLLYNGYRVFPGVRAAGTWRQPPTPI